MYELGKSRRKFFNIGSLPEYRQRLRGNSDYNNVLPNQIGLLGAFTFQEQKQKQ